MHGRHRADEPFPMRATPGGWRDPRDEPIDHAELRASRNASVGILASVDVIILGAFQAVAARRAKRITDLALFLAVVRCAVIAVMVMMMVVVMLSVRLAGFTARAGQGDTHRQTRGATEAPPCPPVESMLVRTGQGHGFVRSPEDGT
jgi:hypothetical protein